MIAPGFTSLRNAFTSFANDEVRSSGRGPQNGPDAARKLLHALVVGRLKTFRFTPTGTPDAVLAEHWQQHSETFVGEIMPPNAFSDISVEIHELNLLLVPPTPNPPEVKTPTSVTRGRKTKADPYMVAAVVGSLVYADKGLTSQADMYRELASQYELKFGAGSAPSENSLKTMIRHLFAEMRRHDKEQEEHNKKAGK